MLAHGHAIPKQEFHMGIAARRHPRLSSAPAPPGPPLTPRAQCTTYTRVCLLRRFAGMSGLIVGSAKPGKQQRPAAVPPRRPSLRRLHPSLRRLHPSLRRLQCSSLGTLRRLHPSLRRFQPSPVQLSLFQPRPLQLVFFVGFQWAQHRSFGPAFPAARWRQPSLIVGSSQPNSPMMTFIQTIVARGSHTTGGRCNGRNARGASCAPTPLLLSEVSRVLKCARSDL